MREPASTANAPEGTNETLAAPDAFCELGIQRGGSTLDAFPDFALHSISCSQFWHTIQGHKNVDARIANQVLPKYFAQDALYPIPIHRPFELSLWHGECHTCTTRMVAGLSADHCVIFINGDYDLTREGSAG